MTRREALPVRLTLLSAIAIAVVLGAVHVPVAGVGSAVVAYASPMEDCDQDGYDDHTGAPVPWVGFDGTRGDTVPPGWDGVSNSWTGDHTNDGSTSAGSSSGSGDSGGSSSGSSSGSSKSSSSGGSKKSTSKSSASSGSSTSGAKAGGTTSVVVTKPGQAAVGTPATVSVAATLAPAPAAPAAASTATILATLGKLQVVDAEGSRLHLGGTLRITGSGFAALADGLDISLDSTGQKLDTASTDDKGGFQLDVDLPAKLTFGDHTVLVSYKGKVIARQVVSIGPATANTLAKALLVGFGDDNPDRTTGLAILVGMVTAGSLAYGTQLGPRRRRRELAPSPEE